MEDSPGRPIPFIEIEKDEDAQKFVFTINPDAISILQEMKDKKVGVLVIAGPQRSGKSYLANKVLDKIGGFKLGSSVQPCTKGIWMWSQAVKLSEDHDFETIILDTEGLNSVQRDVALDSKLFTLSLLLSSTFIYNSLGHIDEQALDNLSLVVNLAKYIDATKEGESGSSDFSTFFPYFIWTLRDFSLDLRGKTSNEYLDSCLKPINGDTLDIKKKNQIRTTINNYFKHRECHCLIRPVNDERQLQRIEEVPLTDMKPEFLEGLNILKEKIQLHMKPKIIDGKVLNAAMLFNLALEYVEALNNETAPNIYSTLERIIHSETRKVCDDVMVEFYDTMAEEFGEDKMPFEEDLLRRRFKELQNQGIKKFEEMTRDFAELAQLIDLRNEISDKMESEFETKLQLNDEMGQLICKRLVTELFNSFNLPAFLSMDDIRESLIIEYKHKFLSFYDNYKKFAKGAHKFAIFADFTPNFLFEFFDKYTANVIRIHQEEITDIKASLNQARSGEAALRKNLEENYETILQFQGEKDEIRRELEKNIRETHLSSSLKDKEIIDLEERNKELSEKLYRKKEKSRDLKRRNESLEQTLEKLKDENNRLRMQQTRLEDTIMDIEKKSLVPSNINSPHTSITNPVLPDLMTTLMKQIDTLRNSLPTSQQVTRQSTSIVEQLDKEEEIAIIKREFDRKLNENWDRTKQMKVDYQRDMENLRKQLELQMTENAKLKVQVIDNTKTIESLQRKDQTINTLKKELSTIAEKTDLEKKQYLVSVEVTEMFKKTVEEMQLKLQDLEGKLGEQSSQVARLSAEKDDIMYAAKNAIKKAVGQNNYLRQAFETLSPETVEEFRELFRELKIKINY